MPLKHCDFWPSPQPLPQQSKAHAALPAAFIKAKPQHLHCVQRVTVTSQGESSRYLTFRL